MKYLPNLYLVFGLFAGCWCLSSVKHQIIREVVLEGLDVIRDLRSGNNHPSNLQTQDTISRPNGNEQVIFSEFSPPQSSIPIKNNLLTNNVNLSPQSSIPIKNNLLTNNVNLSPQSSIPTELNRQSNTQSQDTNPKPNVSTSPQSSSPSTETNLYRNPTTQEPTVIDSIQDLAFDLSGTQYEQGNFGNVVQSPVSISSLLSLILLGSRGDSHAELKRALRYPNNLPDALIHETYQNILGSLTQAASGIIVTTGSRLFLQQEDFNVLGMYTQLAQSQYNSGVQGLDFARNPVGATNEVNRFVEETTNGHIKNLISLPFPQSTKFVAVNTIYFNGNWQFPFSKKLTESGTFNTGKRNITIPMMKNILNVPYLDGDVSGFDMVALPYEGGKYSMIIITPRGNPGTTSLQSVEYSLNSKTVNELIAKMKPRNVSVTIPRMKLNHKIYLKRDLNLLAVKSIFDPILADFGRLTTDPDLYLNDVVHEAVIEVTETGTVAAAATSSALDRIGGIDIFQMNQPSILLIRDVAKGLTLFFARVVEPEPILD